MIGFIVFKIGLLTLKLHWCKLINIWQCCRNWFFSLYPILYSVFSLYQFVYLIFKVMQFVISPFFFISHFILKLLGVAVERVSSIGKFDFFFTFIIIFGVMVLQ